MKKTGRIVNTRLRITQQLLSLFKEPGAFVIFSGDSGSGRTGVLEALISELEAKYQVIFVPCGGDDTPQDLRRLFMTQLLPEAKWDPTLNIADTLLKNPIPGRRKILVIADDVDRAQAGFFEVLKALYFQTLGGGRFAFLVTSHPLWAQTVRRMSDAKQLQEIPMPPLSTSESMAVAASYFKAAGKEREFEEISQQLPQYLEACKGNISKVIRQTELLMDDPKLAQNGRPPENEAQLREFNKKKGHGGAGIFITVICLVIAAICLVPLFLGGSLFGGDDDERSAQGGSGAPVIIPMSSSGNALKESGSDPLENAGITREDVKRAQTETKDEPIADNASQDPLAPPQKSDQFAERQDPKADLGDHGNADKPKQDDGGLLPNLDDGIEASTPKSDTKNSVTLKGETLEAIEKSGAASEKDAGLPRRSLDGSLNKNTEGKEKADADILTREDNALHEAEIKAEDEARAKAQLLAEEAARKDAAVENNIVPANAKGDPKSVPDQGVVSANNKRSTATATPRRERRSSRGFAYYNGAATGRAVPGAVSELWSMDPNHYALQVIAGRNKQAVINASAALEGRYWIYETTRERRPWYVLVTGDYASPNEALRQGRRLPASLRAGGPFAKTFDRIQTEMRLSAANGQP